MTTTPPNTISPEIREAVAENMLPVLMEEYRGFSVGGVNRLADAAITAYEKARPVKLLSANVRKTIEEALSLLEESRPAMAEDTYPARAELERLLP